MAVKIVTVQTFDAAARRIVEHWMRLGKPRIIRLEGFDGVGKSGLAKIIAPRMGANHVQGDDFAEKQETETPYPNCLRQLDLDQTIGSALASEHPVILDAVCLDQIAPSDRWGRGFVVYIKRLSFNNRNPIWQEGLWFEQDEPANEPRRSIVEYHKQFKPHESADLIIELPEDGHSIPDFSFDRGLCFDPPGADIAT